MIQLQIKDRSGPLYVRASFFLKVHRQMFKRGESGEVFSDTPREEKMNRKKMEPAECAEMVEQALKKGIFLTTANGDKVNSMVIGWGHIGRIWNRQVFVVYVRKSRYTRELLDKNPEFTVNVPVNGYSKEAFAICGSKSGRDMDKIRESGLTVVPAEVVSVPAIKEFPLTLECRVLYRQEQDSSMLPDDIRSQFYAVENDDHIAYFGEIVSAYMLEV